jgi:molybdopterin synthase sulfur carrier subunit
MVWVPDSFASFVKEWNFDFLALEMLASDGSRSPGETQRRNRNRRRNRVDAMIRVELPQHLRTLAHVGREVEIEVDGAVTQRSVLDALEARYPMLRGTIRDHGTEQRRAFLRFFACEQDLSHEPPDSPLPAAVASGTEPFLIIGAIAGG